MLVMDGLRPDCATAQLMPHRRGLADRGVSFDESHSVFPTCTRVNSTSISTGAYPETHGRLGKTVYSEDVSDKGCQHIDPVLKPAGHASDDSSAKLAREARSRLFPAHECSASRLVYSRRGLRGPSRAVRSGRAADQCH